MFYHELTVYVSLSHYWWELPERGTSLYLWSFSTVYGTYKGLEILDKSEEKRYSQPLCPMIEVVSAHFQISILGRGDL